MVATRLAPNVVFASGGWSQVESATGWRVADAPDVSAFDIATVAGSQEVVTAPTAGTELVPVDNANAGSVVPVVSKPLDPDPATDLLMREYNEKFAVVAEGGTTSVVRLAYNAELHRRMPVSMSLDAFKLLYGNRWIEVQRPLLAPSRFRQQRSGLGIRLAAPARTALASTLPAISPQAATIFGKAMVWNRVRVTGLSSVA